MNEYKFVYRLNMEKFCNDYPSLAKQIDSKKVSLEGYAISFPNANEVLFRHEDIEVLIFDITDDDLAGKIAVEIIEDVIRKRKTDPISISDYASLEVKEFER